MQLTENFSLEEMTASVVAIMQGIKNEPGLVEKSNLRELCVHILQPLRDAIGPVSVDSGFRCRALNSEVGGSTTSQHVSGEAADIKTADMDKAFDYIMNHLPFDQLIWEYGNDHQPAWIHVSFSDRNRRQALRKRSGHGYEPFKKIES